jgi:hypothetical protein
MYSFRDGLLNSFPHVATLGYQTVDRIGCLILYELVHIAKHETVRFVYTDAMCAIHYSAGRDAQMIHDQLDLVAMSLCVSSGALTKAARTVRDIARSCGLIANEHLVPGMVRLNGEAAVPYAEYLYDVLPFGFGRRHARMPSTIQFTLSC